MAYAAVISLKQTIQLFVNSHIIIVPLEFVYSQESESRSFLTRKSGKEFLLEITEFAYVEVVSLQNILKDINSSSKSKKLNTLDEQIRETAHKLEDILESHLCDQFNSQFDQSLGDFGSSINLQKLKQDIDSFTETVKRMKDDFIIELNNPSLQEYDDVSPRIVFGGKKTKMVGFNDHLSEIKNLMSNWWSSKVQTISLVGMAGIGKTTLAKEIFEDSQLFRQYLYRGFQCRAFVTIGPDYQLREIMLSIIAQVNCDDNTIHTQLGDDELVEYLKESLFRRRYFIVLDDVWNEQAWDDLKKLFPEINNGSRILMTTRLEEVARASSSEDYAIVKMRFLNKEESWNLLREQVFDEKPCPFQLEKDGRKIAENCDGLPLLIVTIANILLKTEKTLEYWNKVANKENSVFIDAYDELSNILYPSYMYLPQHLKACFLYMGVFPQKHKISLTKLMNMWIAEGFLEPNRHVEYFAEKCLRELVSKSLVIVHQMSFTTRIKTCGLHSVFWHLCNKEARKNMFSGVINTRDEVLSQGIIENKRRLCIHNNILFGIKDVYNSMASISNARSLLCTGPHHQYPVPICFDLKLLRVLDALTIRFYEFPIEVLKLVQLRYLAITYNGNLPSSISKLWKLQFLIVRRHLSTGILCLDGTLSYLPVEIWNMEELKHLQIMGSDLCDTCDGALLPNLLTLLDVNAQSFTEDVLVRIPNLLKLGVRIEMSPSDDEPFCFFAHISHLRKLKSLKCVVVNPTLRSKVVIPSSPPILPYGLVKLTLSGFGYPWECMREIAKLPYLEVLKLRFYAFRSPSWVTCDDGFLRLKVLVIEDANLVHWSVGKGSFPYLKHLIIKHCYRLEEIPEELGHTVKKFEIDEFSSLAVACAKKIEEDQWDRHRNVLHVYVHSSGDDDKLNL